ncbi:MAG: hypothetical protein Q8830_03705 [Candidatus Phytoplasma australasiaticum]|nr:hypothetical protein [Candidatus Phytoplasma australasiaticum]
MNIKNIGMGNTLGKTLKRYHAFIQHSILADPFGFIYFCCFSAEPFVNPLILKIFYSLNRMLPFCVW